MAGGMPRSGGRAPPTARPSEPSACLDLPSPADGTNIQGLTGLRRKGAMRDHETLPRLPANHVPLTPLSFLLRSARVYPDKVAAIHGARRFTYAEMLARCRRLASALAKAGVEPGDVVSVL